MKIVIEVRLSELGKPGSISMPLCVEKQSFFDIFVAISTWMAEHDERNPDFTPVPQQNPLPTDPPSDAT